MHIKLKYIRISLDIYQHISYHVHNKKTQRKQHIDYENIPNA